MKAIKQQQRVLQDVEELISMMYEEINLLRNIALRYHLQHGFVVKEGEVVVPNEVSFDLNVSSDDSVVCKVIDHDFLGVTSRYQKILKSLSTLNQ